MSEILSYSKQLFSYTVQAKKKKKKSVQGNNVYINFCKKEIKSIWVGCI